MCFRSKFLIRCEAYCQKIENSNLYISKTVKEILKISNGSEFRGAKAMFLKKNLQKIIFN